MTESFIQINSGYYEIGIDKEHIQVVVDSLHSEKIKSRHLSASAPSHRVFINEFRISSNLVTYSEFKNFIEDTSYITEAENEGWGWVWESGWRKVSGASWISPFMNEYDEVYRSGTFPVMQISWNDAVRYTDWMSLKTHEKFRLPYEIEWEVFAQRAGLKSMKDSLKGNKQVINDIAGFLRMLSAGSLYQLGLIWEWTLDWYKGYDLSSEDKDYGTIYKVLRGGSLLSESIQRSYEFRFRRCPTARSPYYGFRMIKEI